MDAYDPMTVFSSIDEIGRYAYANQAPIAQWNLARFAETLLSLIDDDRERAIAIATERVNGFTTTFTAHWLAGMRRKTGLFTEEEGDDALIWSLLDAMQFSRADFTLTFRRLCDVAEGRDAAPLRDLFAGAQRLDDWMGRWQARLAREPQAPQERAAAMRRVNPAFIARNHRVEAALAAAVNAGDLAPFDELFAVLSRPYDDQPDMAHYADPPGPEQGSYRTFCGT
jgi:uncharacterized protein YdiU (UPF0061 family)